MEKTNEEWEKYFIKSVKDIDFICSDNGEPITDYNGNPYSAIVDLPLTMSYKNQIKIIAWYDNETGYSHRMIDLAKYVMSKES